MPPCDAPVNNGQFAAFIYRNTNVPIELQMEQYAIDCIDFVNQDFSIIYVPLEGLPPLSVQQSGFTPIPKLYALMDTSSMEASGIQAALGQPALNLDGRGVMIGLVDTGIDYTNPLFRNPDGTTRILGVWDQTVTEPPYGIPPMVNGYPILYGREYTEMELNAALLLDDPFTAIPSLDSSGHGTFMAGIAAGRALPDQDFTGAAPGCYLGVVRLRQASQYLRDFFLIREDAEAYQENDIMMGIRYLQNLAILRQVPLVIFLGLGTNQGSHTGTGPLGLTLQRLSTTLGLAVVCAAGNETGYQHHYMGLIPENQEYEDVEINVGPNERGFCLELWAKEPDLYSVGFISPTGQQVPRLTYTGNAEIRLPFLLEGSEITVTYRMAEAGSGNQLIFMRFQNPTAGIWKIRVYNALYLSGLYHMWLPVHGFLSDETVFLMPNPDTTITDPGNAIFPITVGAYNHMNDSIYLHSSRGFTRYGWVKPDLVAPGVSVFGPTASPSPNRISPATQGDPSISFTRNSGTSVAAAHVAGAVADLMSWGIIQGNDQGLSAASIKTALVRGANRNPAYTYPSREWGYGTLNLFQTFQRMRE